MNKLSTITLPYTAMKFLYKTTRGDKIVCEIDVKSLKKVNEPSTIDDMIAEARIEYFSGKAKGFHNIAKLLNHLNS